MKNTLYFLAAVLSLHMPCGASAADVELGLQQALRGETAQQQMFNVGDIVEIELQALNTGPEAGTGVAIAYDWSPALELIDATSVPAAATTLDIVNNRLVWHLGDLPSAAPDGIGPRLLLTARIGTEAEGRTFSGDMAVLDIDQSIRTEFGPTASIAVKGQATVDLSVSVDGSFSRSGKFYTVTYDVTVSNAGPEAAAAAVLQLQIDPVTFDLIEDGNITGPANTICDVDLLACLVEDFSAGASVVFRATALVSIDDAPLNVPVDFIVSSNDIDTDNTNNRAFGRVFLPVVEGGGGGGGGAIGTVTAAFLLLLLCCRRRFRFSNAAGSGA